MKEDRKMPKITDHDGSAQRRFLRYIVTIKEKGLHIKRHGSLHLIKDQDDIWYVWPYMKYSKAQGSDDEDAVRIRKFWRFMDGSRRYYPYFYLLYLRAIRQVLWITKWFGRVELVTVPRSDPEKENPVAQICSAIVREESFILATMIDGTDLIRRVHPIMPVHMGGKHTKEEMAVSMALTRPIKARKILLVDDMVFRGTTISACKSLLKQAGAKRVVSLCLYGYKREQK